jgi:hypothetical protein
MVGLNRKVIVGSGGQGRKLATIALAIAGTADWQLVGFLDDSVQNAALYSPSFARASQVICNNADWSEAAETSHQARSPRKVAATRPRNIAPPLARLGHSGCKQLGYEHNAVRAEAPPKSKR